MGEGVLEDQIVEVAVAPSQQVLPGQGAGVPPGMDVAEPVAVGGRMGEEHLALAPGQAFGAAVGDQVPTEAGGGGQLQAGLGAWRVRSEELAQADLREHRLPVARVAGIQPTDPACRGIGEIDAHFTEIGALLLHPVHREERRPSRLSRHHESRRADLEYDVVEIIVAVGDQVLPGKAPETLAQIGAAHPLQTAGVGCFDRKQRRHVRRALVGAPQPVRDRVVLDQIEGQLAAGQGIERLPGTGLLARLQQGASALAPQGGLVIARFTRGDAVHPAQVVDSEDADFVVVERLSEAPDRIQMDGCSRVAIN